jgi:hypothetical protein
MLANAEEAAEAAVAIDPTVLALLTIFGSVTVTVLVGLIGAWLQSKREHARWLRERRFEAVVNAYALTKGFDLNWSKTMKIASSEGATEDNPRLQAMLAQADELYTKVAETLAPLAMLGPQDVASNYLDMQNAYESHDKEAFGKAEVAYQESVRRALGIKS